MIPIVLLLGTGWKKEKKIILKATIYILHSLKRNFGTNYVLSGVGDTKLIDSEIQGITAYKKCDFSAIP